ncbi:MAG: AAA family ATPase [Desulfomonile tiedjei]|uniref:AAA family ATPase n=1 Tax=Desulfomonile tiedjei TaxID=2358 RepID=A0A9D6Z867_9BACT|nr:AAA family ATPase [Desulfomonile tiedjei]
MTTIARTSFWRLGHHKDTELAEKGDQQVMKLREVIVKNFRCLKAVRIPITDSTVFLGENNSGKTALLDALRVALTRNPRGRDNPFGEYDYHMVGADDSPKSSQGISIELWFREDSADEWPQSLIQALEPVTQVDPITGTNSIGFRVSSRHDAAAGEFVHEWAFLAANGEPLPAGLSKPANFAEFRSFVRFFYLSSLRDAQNEFSSRSQFWGSLLRGIEIREEDRLRLQEELRKLNADLLGSVPVLEHVRDNLEGAQGIFETAARQSTTIQALPMRTWDLMSKAGVFIKTRGGDLDLPLTLHGQGAQSLAVIFLFQAFIGVSLKSSFRPETEAILAMEEPEAHLHPQATRALAETLRNLGSQVLVSSHSPYFVQEVPFKDIRIFRREGAESKVLYIRQEFTVEVPPCPALDQFCANNPLKFSYATGKNLLTACGTVEESDYRRLLAMYASRRDEIHPLLKRFRDDSYSYLSDDELDELDTYAKRIRGEVLFARAWILCEGQSEYVLIKCFAGLMGLPLDRAGVTVIDFQNNGSPGAFVGLARAFQIPWIMVCDNDQKGAEFVEQVRKRGLTESEIEGLVFKLPGEGVKLEEFLLRNGLASELRKVLAEKGVKLVKKQGEQGCEEEMMDHLRRDKTGCALALVNELRDSGADESRVPQLFRSLIRDITQRAL